MADNLAKNENTESESLLFGSNFGVLTDIKTGPNGNLYVLCLLDGDPLRDLPSPGRNPQKITPFPGFSSGEGGFSCRLSQPHSYFKALTGIRFAARRAGYKPESRPIRVAKSSVDGSSQPGV